MKKEGFFDESILRQDESLPEFSKEDLKTLKYHANKEGESLKCFIEINEERLNAREIRALLKQNSQKRVFSKEEEQFLVYLQHRLGTIQSFYKLHRDVDLFMEAVLTSKYPFIYNGEEIISMNQALKLKLSLELDEESFVVLNYPQEGEAFFASETAYLIKNSELYKLNPQLELRYYKELFSGQNKFSINSFLKVKDDLIPKLKKTQNLTISKEVEQLSSLALEEEIAPIVLQIAKTSNFVILELKYKVAEELFTIQDYKYSETSSWSDKNLLITIKKEKNQLKQYLSDLELSEEVFMDYLGMSIQKHISPNNPFELKFPLTAFEYILEHIIPRLEHSFPLVYKGNEKFELKHLAAEILVDIHLEKKINLFDFKARFKLGDREFKLEELKLILQGGRKNIILEDGTVMSIENLWELRRWMDFLERFTFKHSEKEFKGPVSAALELDEFLSGTEKKTVKGNQEFLEAIQELREKKPVQKIELPKEVEHLLRDYQKEGVYWLHFLCKYGFGGILADEMGLGKTVQALSLLNLHKEDGVHLILCPKSLIYTWEAEVKKFFPKMKILIIDGESAHRKELLKDANKYNLLISSYSLLQKDYQNYLDEGVEPNITILDEAHYLKNMHTQSSKAVRLLPAKHRFLLTGTPLENNLDELYSAFELIMPGYLGERNEFRREYMLRIEQNSQNALKELQAKIRPFILRRTKSQVLKELPEKQEQRIFCEMSNKQTALYKELIARLRGEVKHLVEKQGFEQSRIQVLSAILKLRQICNHAGLLDKRFLGEDDISGKYELFLELLTESIDSGSKCLIFSQFTSMLDIMEEDLKKEGINYLRLDGSTKNRQELVEQFNSDEEVQVFLISLKAGGVGLNLTAASRVFLYDPWWNPMAEQQAVDRAHRIGQEKSVHIYKLITKNSIEEKILKLQERKGRLFDNLVKEEEGVFKRLEWDDLLGLFDED